MHDAVAPAPGAVSEAMRADHRRLEALFDRVLNLVHVNDLALADATWTAFERGLTAHLEAEEQWMFPLLESAAPEAVPMLRRDHAVIRAELAEIGVELEIHVLREETVERFRSLLRAHAAREDGLLYGWADRALPDDRRAPLMERLRASSAERG